MARSGAALARAGRILEAIEILHAAIRRAPEFAEAHNNLAGHYLALGDYDASERHYRLACHYQPDFHQAFSNLLILGLYTGSLRSEALAGFRAWAQRSASLTPISAPKRPYQKGKPIRIGYLSADYHSRNPVPKFVVPLLRGHDRRRFVVFGYSNVGRPDDVTAKVKGWCDAWREIHGRSDEEAAATIRRDEIDILVDLSGHWSGNRLGVFLRRPAPLQISYLGYPGATSLPQIDCRISDEWADPHPSREAGLVCLPCSYFCFEPPADAPAPAEEPPQSRCGWFTFGSFNYRPKITPQVAAAWAAILRAVPGSRLLLHRHDMDAADVRRSLLDQFSVYRVESTRIVFENGRASMKDHLELYKKVDLALDPFPYNGATTTCEALFMGTPVLTCAGTTHASRIGASLLSAVGLGALITRSVEAYVQAAILLAERKEAIWEARNGLRAKMGQSTVLQHSRFLAAFEAALEETWRQSAGERDGHDDAIIGLK
ncbi:MAG: glycosyltransferase [Bryobacterales bacterium]|nr:glycosyltransferase [Bryobacterales bacterium]